MKRVLCISPHFPPVNAADMHRLRQSLPWMRANGWEPVVFAVDPADCETASDPLLLRTIPDDVEVHHVRAFSPRLTRKVGLGNLGFRCWLQLRRAVDAYLSRHRVDLIFFTTTVFTAIAHGPHWKRKFGVPFVVDLQDPWRNDYYLSLPREKRPRKFAFDYWQKSRLEARTMPEAAGVLAVSEPYIRTVQERYPALRGRPELTLPFAAALGDMDIARTLPEVRTGASGGTSQVVVRYVGRGGPDMAKALTILFRALRRETFSRLRFEFYGTSYARAGHGVRTILPVAVQEGVADQVREIPDRLPYFVSLRHLLDADALVIIGSDDAAYTASKVYPYALAGRPLLSIFHESSTAAEFVRNTNAGTVATFGTGDDRENAVDCAYRALSAMVLDPPTVVLDQQAFAPFTAEMMTRRLCHLFETSIAGLR
ncbi:MAG: glycosyltransferase [Minwuia sp.]|nr:glycosyltransferase [Minwuia sp.]